MNKKLISLVLGIMCFLLTFGIAVQIKTVNGTGTTVSTNSKENELRDAVLKAKEKYELYDNKAHSGLEAAENLKELSKRFEKIGYKIVVSRGDIKKGSK